MNPRDDIRWSLSTGIDVESDDPNLRDLVQGISQEQVEWIAAWLAGEGFRRD